MKEEIVLLEVVGGTPKQREALHNTGLGVGALGRQDGEQRHARADGLQSRAHGDVGDAGHVI